MASAMRKMALYFGFAENDRYADEEHDEEWHESEDRLRLVDQDERVIPDDEPAPALARIMTLRPRTYNDALRVGEGFRDGSPVILDLTEMSDDDAKRLVDFAAGLTFGRSGSIDRIAAKVFLLSPSHVEVGPALPKQ